MDIPKHHLPKNLVLQTVQYQSGKPEKVLLFVTVFAILLLVSWLAGRTIGKDLGEFIYNVTH